MDFLFTHPGHLLDKNDPLSFSNNENIIEIKGIDLSISIGSEYLTEPGKKVLLIIDRLKRNCEHIEPIDNTRNDRICSIKALQKGPLFNDCKCDLFENKGCNQFYCVGRHEYYFEWLSWIDAYGKRKSIAPETVTDNSTWKRTLIDEKRYIHEWMNE